MNKIKEFILEVLLDQNALDADRDDAAMELGEEFDDELVLNALIQVASNPGEIYMILNSCGEAIGRIWVRKNSFNEEVYKKLPKISQDGIYFVIKSRKPSWINTFHLTEELLENAHLMEHQKRLWISMIDLIQDYLEGSSNDFYTLVGNLEGAMDALELKNDLIVNQWYDYWTPLEIRRAIEGNSVNKLKAIEELQDMKTFLMSVLRGCGIIR